MLVVTGAEALNLTRTVRLFHHRGLGSASSVQKARRFMRWLRNEAIDVEPLYAPMIRHALGSWQASRLFLTVDTSHGGSSV